jgi:bifunctional N-acetylglucosamine-1-phosphate-uridyltransferase/glucosamine-1-phosphate-acetyltransferase GlmU-like protein
MEGCRVDALFHDFSTTRARPHLQLCRYPWEILEPLSAVILALGASLPESDFERRGEGIWISRRATVAEDAHLCAPCIVEDGAELRHGAFLRGGTLVGRGAVVGNSCELKNCILFDGVQVPHFNYVGDSIIGYRGHLGAGVILSNVKLDRGEIIIPTPDGLVPTGLKKFGAIIGDRAEIGCNSVINPGSLIGRGSILYPGTVWRGIVPADSIVKTKQEHQILPRRD